MPVTSATFTGTNHGFQLAENRGHISVNFQSPTGHCISKFKEDGDSSILGIAWLKDGSRLISVSTPRRLRVQVRTWNPATGQSVLNIKGRKDWNSLYSLSQDGRRFASGSFDNAIRVWDIATGHRLGVASKLENNISTWDIPTTKRVSILKGHSTPVISATWSQDGSRLIAWSAVPFLSSLASYDRTISIWDVTTRKRMLAMRGYFGIVVSDSIAWSQDMSQFALGSDQASSAIIFDSATGECISTLKGHNGSVNAVAWSHDGSRLASGSSDGTIRIWDPAIIQRTSKLEGHTDQIYLIVWSKDRTRLASVAKHYDTTVMIWDPATGQCISTLRGHTGFVNSVTWSHDGSRLASRCSDGTIGIWNPTTGQFISILEGHSGKTASMIWSPDASRLASGCSDGTIRIWNPTTGQCVSILEGHSGKIISMIWSPDGSRIASESSHDEAARIWDPASGQCESTLDISSSKFLEFDKVTVGSSTIETPDPTTATSCRPAPLAQQYDLNDDRSWVNYKGVNFLWLPPEYRPGRPDFCMPRKSRSNFSISGNSLALGCSSGRVIFLRFSQHQSIHGF
ncbi:hypothetical protein N7540_006393 [Penicillium herquei]|nr:hypothetical protein N7540_006393 [Penicillium herquei]